MTKNKHRPFGLTPLTVSVWVCCCLVVTYGCNKAKISGLVPAEGVVIYDGVPLPWAMVSLAPENTTENSRLATAQTDGQGKFALKTLGDSGALPGTYKVSISKYIPNEGKDSQEKWLKDRKSPDFFEPQPEETFNVVFAIPEKYTKTKTSGLSLTIDPKGNRKLVIEFDN